MRFLDSAYASARNDNTYQKKKFVGIFSKILDITPPLLIMVYEEAKFHKLTSKEIPCFRSST